MEKLYTLYPKIEVFVFFFSWLSCMPCGIFVPQPGIEPGPSAVKVPSPKLFHWYFVTPNASTDKVKVKEPSFSSGVSRRQSKRITPPGKEPGADEVLAGRVVEIQNALRKKEAINYGLVTGYKNENCSGFPYFLFAYLKKNMYLLDCAGCLLWQASSLVADCGIEPRPPALGAPSLSHWSPLKSLIRLCVC